MPIYNQNGSILTKIVQSAISRPDIIKSKHRTLDGKWVVQSIGTGATILDVAAYFTLDEKIAFDQINKTCTPIKVVFDGRYYNGVIDGDPSISRIPSSKKPMFGISFVLLVNSEGVV